MALVIDLGNEAVSVNALVPQTLAATAQGSSKDFTNGEISLNAIVSVGAYGANTTNLQVQIEESADGSTNWTAIPGMVVTATTSNAYQVVRGQRTHRYVRANAVSVQGTTPSVAVGVVIISQAKISGTGGGYSRLPSS
jgi:hypothetical protein